jgi:hypothetical protein
MTLIDRLKAARPEDLGRDLLDVLGYREGDAVRLDREGLTVGAETVTLPDFREAVGHLRGEPYRLAVLDLEPPTDG